MQISILGIDIGKNSCSVVGVDDRGAVVVRRTMRRQTLIELVEKLPACVIAMEACCGAHHFGRLFAARGHEIRLMSPEYVRPYVRRRRMMTEMPRALPRRHLDRRCGLSI
ncbi:transposase family protein (plasmid) [Agrobacterium sp. RAC06]|nr:transposase family protein [Agrobacterium sp. RAC06]